MIARYADAPPILVAGPISRHWSFHVLENRAKD